MRCSGSGKTKCALRPFSQLVPTELVDQQQFSKRQAEEAEIFDVSMRCSYLSFYLRELLCHLINTVVIGGCEITESAVLVCGRKR